MRILMVTQWFDPEPTFKGLAFARVLQAQGHDVQVLTGFPNYPGGKVYPGFRIRAWQREKIEGVRVTRVPLYPSHDRSALGRILNYVSFALSAALAVLVVPRPHVVYLYHPPGTAALPAFLLRWLRGVPFVMDIQDMWPDTLASTGMIGSPRVLGLIARWMRLVYASAAHIVALSEGFRGLLLARGVSEYKVSVIPNWTYEDEPVAPYDPELAADLGFADRFNIVFAGTMGAAQALDTVLDAADLLRARLPQVRFVLIGGGIERERLVARAAERGLDNVVFLPRRPPSEIPAILALADGLLVHLRDDRLFDITIPSKTQAYLRSGRPVLMGVRGDAMRIVEEARCGLAFQSEDAASLADAVAALAACPAGERERMGAAGRQYYERMFSLAVGGGRWVGILDRARFAGRRGFGLKRTFDILAALLLVAVFAIPMLLVALAVALKLGRPVLFSQPRPGRYGAPFRLRKFRTMTDGVDANGMPLPDRDRLTPFGAWLRTTSLDELPSLFNILTGDMSLVGPRPLLVRYTRFFTAEERLRLLMRPGLTGWAQVNGRNHASWDDRLALDVHYVRNWTLAFDIRILVRTALQVVRRRDIVPDAESIMQNLDDERRNRVQDPE